MLIKYADKIRSLEDEKWQTFMELGDCIETERVFAEIDAKLVKLYDWAAHDYSFFQTVGSDFV